MAFIYCCLLLLCIPCHCSKRVGKSKNDEWLRFFDVVIVGCGKPGFFSERRPLFAVNTRDGSLQNTDNGAPIIPIGEEDLPDNIQVCCWVSVSRERDVTDTSAVVLPFAPFTGCHMPW